MTRLVLLDGMRRVASAPAILVLAWLMTVLVSVPLTLAVRGSIRDHLGASLEAESISAGADLDWMQEFGEGASGVETTFGPTVIGFAAVLDNLSAFVDDTARPALIGAAGAAYLLLWIFLAGGVIDRYARDRATGAHGFFAACGVFFVRFLRLGVVAWLVYAFLFGYVHPRLFDDWYAALTRETGSERTAFAIRLSLYTAFLALLGACNLIFDYAKVRAVVEDRRSMLAALLAAVRFVRRNSAAAVQLYLMNVALFAGVLGVYALAAPGAGSAGPSMWIAFAIGQLYLLARLGVKLLFWASGTALFQSRLAHAGYVRRPLPVWPESPVVDAATRPRAPQSPL